MLTTTDSRLLTFIGTYLWIAAIGRGSDYIVRDVVAVESSERNWALAVLSSAAPLMLWGIMLVLVGVVGLAAQAWRMHTLRNSCSGDLPANYVDPDMSMMLYCAHALGACIYFTVAVGTMVTVVMQG
jgi:hypothetical protein